MMPNAFGLQIADHRFNGPGLCLEPDIPRVGDVASNMLAMEDDFFRPSFRPATQFPSCGQTNCDPVSVPLSPGNARPTCTVGSPGTELEFAL